MLWDITIVKQFICALLAVNVNCFEDLPTDIQTDYFTAFYGVLLDYPDIVQETYNRLFPNQNKAPGSSGPSAPLNYNLFSAGSSTADPITCRQMENMRNSALNLGAIPTSGLSAGLSTYSSLGAITSALPFSATALYPTVASISSPNMSRERKYTDEKQLKCSICNKRFVRVNGLNDHLRTHKNEREFPCPYEGCDYSAKTASNLCSHKNHQHRDKRQFSCPNCDGKFLSERGLKTHYSKKHK